MPQVATVETRELTKCYADVAALVDCSLTVHTGEVLGLLGPNGSGKTTLLRLLLGFLRPTRGVSRVFGHDCWRDSVTVHGKVAYLPGDARLPRWMRGRDVLDFFSRVRSDGDIERAQTLARRLDLDLSRRVANMSTGMRQKLALSAVLSSAAPLAILDEPTANLDPTARREVLELVAEAKASGRTIVFSSHVLAEVEEACDRVVVLRAGRLVHSQVMEELKRRHRIRASLAGELANVPPDIARRIAIDHDAAAERITIDTEDGLAELLSWLATLPLAEVQIEPLGLRAVYEQFHAAAECPITKDQ
jgi:ABC-2 type transport system ATP-binding protein